jgi:hypothetical protein
MVQRFLSAQADRFTGSKTGRKNRKDSFEMTGGEPYGGRTWRAERASGFGEDAFVVGLVDGDVVDAEFLAGVDAGSVAHFEAVGSLAGNISKIVALSGT